MLSVLLAIALSQTQPAVRRSTPASDDPGMVVRQAGTVSVNCVSGCSGGGGGGWVPDGGNIGSVNQGLAADGGTSWGVNVTHLGDNAINLGAGAAGVGTQRVILATDQTPVPASQSGTWNINNVSGTVSLPTGAATSALQTTGNTSLANIDSDLDVSLSTRLADSTFTGRFPAASLLSDAVTNPTLTGIGSYLFGYNGSTWDRLRSSTANGLLVDVSRIGSGTNYIGRTRLTDGTLDVTLLNSAPPSDTGQVAVPVRVISSLAGGSGGTSSSYGAAFPGTGTAAGFTDGTNMQGARVFDTDTGAGTQYVLGANLRVSASGGSVEAAAGAGTTSASTLRVVLPTDQTAIPVTDNGGSLTVDGTGSDNSSNSTAKVPVLPARANASAPSWTDGNQVPLSVDTAGALRITGTVTSNVGTGTRATNLTQYGGVAVGASNAIHVQPGTGAQFSVVGTKSQNAVTPGNNNIGALVAQVSTTDPSWGDTNQTTLSVDTTGFLRVRQGILVGASMRTAEGYDADTGAGTNFLPGVLLRFSASGGSVEAAAGAGTTTSGTLRVVLPTDQTAIPISSVGGTVNVSGTVDVSDSFLLDSTFTGRFQAAAAASDNFSNPTTTGVLGFGMVWDGAAWDRQPGNSTDGVLVNLGANNDVTVTSGNVAATQSGTWSVRTQDGSGNALESATAPTVGTNRGLLVRPVDKTATAPLATSVSCGTSPTPLPATPLTNRRSLCIFNTGAGSIYIGHSTVTTANGFEIPVNGSWCDDVGSQVYYCVNASGVNDVRVLEN